MTTNAYSAQHNQLFVDDSLGTLNEWTDFCDSINVKVGNDDRDGTSFKAGGLSIAETHTKGALTASVEVKGKYTRTAAGRLRQIVGSISGFTVRTMSGANAAPTFGDEVFQMEATLSSVQLTVAPGQNVMFNATFVPADGGSPAPELTRY